MSAPGPTGTAERRVLAPRVVGTVVVALVAIASTVFAAHLARHGMVTTPDSVVYEGTAANVRAGHGVTSPITTVAVDVAPDRAVRFAGHVPLVQFPPMFPATLALLGHLGLSTLDAARALNSALLGVNVLLAGLLAIELVGPRRWWWSLPVVAAMVLAAPRVQRSPLLLLHGSVLSEPLMIALVLGSLLALVRFVRTRAWPMLVVAAVLASLATSTRFVGVAMVLTVAIAAWTWGRGAPTVRAAAAAGALALGVGPTTAFIVVQEQRLHGWGHPAAFGSPVRALHQLATGLTQWFVTTSSPTAFRVAVLVALALLVVIAVHQQTPTFRLRSDEERQARSARPVVAVLAVVYLAVVVASRLTFDQNVALWGRHLELEWILVLCLLADLVAGTERSVPSRWLVLVLAAGLTLSATVPGARQLPALSRSGFRSAGVTRNPSLARTVRAIPTGEAIFTNIPEGVYALGGRPALIVPCRTNYYTHGPNPHYRSDLAELQALVRRHRAALVLDTLSPLGEGSCYSGHDAYAAGWRPTHHYSTGAQYLPPKP